MKRYILPLIVAGLLLSPNVKADHTESYRVSPADVHGGFVMKKIWLDNYALPTVQVEGLQYAPGATLPEGAMPGAATKPDILLGMEKKRPFAVLRIPAYAVGEGNTIKRVTAFTLTVKEAETPAKAAGSAAKTTATISPLAAGTWYKVSVPATGFYKLDYGFITGALGVDVSKISPADIRVFGNGGHMISENNAIPSKGDIQENAIWVNDGGDGSFGQGDYVVFYAEGPSEWVPDFTGKRFTHKKNLYDDKAYYFINFGGGGKRVADHAPVTGANITLASFDAYAVHEEDLFNPSRTGKLWWGEDFGRDLGRSDTRDIQLNMPGATDMARYRVMFGSSSSISGNTFTVSMNGRKVGNYELGASYEDSPIRVADGGWDEAAVAVANFNIKYSSGASNAVGYLNYIEANYRAQLALNGSSLLFRDIQSVGAGNVVAYRLGNATAGTQVWDVTDAQNPKRMQGTLNGNTYEFIQDASTLHEFAAFNGDQLPVPELVGPVNNQNLHGHDFVDYIIVAYPDFIPAANKLADFHRARGLRVLVVTPGQIYNEFSSGSQDISAIRDLAKMFYQRAGTSEADMPKYLLLLGDASYDYKGRVANNTNYVPTFESAQSISMIYSFCADDFFGFLDDSEDIENANVVNAMDIGVGRLPVKTLAEAEAVVNKIIEYKSPASLGPWRLSTTYVADNEDNAGPHMEDGEIMDTTVQINSTIYNATKVYLDAVPMVSTPGGQRAPDANKMINDRVYQGTFLINYNGHGNIDVLAHERIITQDDYSKWSNIHRLPFMITATCDFGRFDHPEYVSAGERIVLKPDGGAIASLTTTQLVYQSGNRMINRDFLDAQFRHTGSQWNTFGDAFRIGKNKTYSQAPDEGIIINFRKFALLGDPALEPDFPEYFIRTDEVLDAATLQPTDTVGALGAYVIKGSVTDVNGNVLNNFNGNLSVSFFDKLRIVNTLTGIEKTFKTRNNVIYKGKATVIDGKFSFTFIAPKDINYEYGEGKLSYYAENGSTDAAGSDFETTVGGYSDNPVIENDAPIVRPYIGDTLFRNGGITGPNTLLYVILEDQTGINVSGNSVGHDLVGILDGDVANPYILNDYYETELNTYKKGYVNFPLNNLAEGRHRLTVKAWDVNNNSGEGYVDFEVVNGAVVSVRNLMNYPNPFKDRTNFVFEHNHPDEALEVEINVYNTQGVHVRNLKQVFRPQGSRSNEITWDGTDNNGVLLPSGVYVYRMKLATDKGIHELAYQKLVIVR